MQNTPNSELFATLHQLAAAVTTVFEALADTHPEDRPKPAAPPPASAPPPAHPQPGNTPSHCIACSRPCDGIPARLGRGHICEPCIQAMLEDLSQQRRRQHALDLAHIVEDRLDAFDPLIAEAVDGDGAHSLPILSRELTRLWDLFRERKGVFAAQPGADLS